MNKDVSKKLGDNSLSPNMAEIGKSTFTYPLQKQPIEVINPLKDSINNMEVKGKMNKTFSDYKEQFRDNKRKITDYMEIVNVSFYFHQGVDMAFKMSKEVGITDYPINKETKNMLYHTLKEKGIISQRLQDKAKVIKTKYWDLPIDHDSGEYIDNMFVHTETCRICSKNLIDHSIDYKRATVKPQSKGHNKKMVEWARNKNTDEWELNVYVPQSEYRKAVKEEMDILLLGAIINHYNGNIFYKIWKDNKETSFRTAELVKLAITYGEEVKILLLDTDVGVDREKIYKEHNITVVYYKKSPKFPYSSLIEQCFSNIAKDMQSQYLRVCHHCGYELYRGKTERTHTEIINGVYEIECPDCGTVRSYFNWYEMKIEDAKELFEALIESHYYKLPYKMIRLYERIVEAKAQKELVIQPLWVTIPR